MRFLSTPKQLLILEAFIAVLLPAFLLLISGFDVSLSFFVGFFIGFFSNFVFYCCILSQKKAKSAVHELGTFYAGQALKMLLAFLLIVLAFSCQCFYAPALIVGVVFFYLINIFVIIVTGLNWSKHIGSNDRHPNPICDAPSKQSDL